MVVGFNHNFRYKGEVYHIQTEDSGIRSPNIVTLLYQGGTILASKKTSYADITRVDNLERVVEELMKEQHKEMLRGLKAGKFDAAIERFLAARKGTPGAAAGKPEEAQTPPVSPADVVLQKRQQAAAAVPDNEAVLQPPRKPVTKAEPKTAQEPPVSAPGPSSAPADLSLDDMILSYLMEDDK
ncbi:MAG: hypothetical protein ACWGOL_01445 [Desulfuromonadales bacterium]